nr:uncharacterized protein LOC109171666 [Ipomoea batatas]
MDEQFFEKTLHVITQQAGVGEETRTNLLEDQFYSSRRLCQELSQLQVLDIQAAVRGNEIKSGWFGLCSQLTVLCSWNAPPEEEEVHPSPQADCPTQPQAQGRDPARRITALELTRNEQNSVVWRHQMHINAVAQRCADGEQRQEGDAVGITIDWGEGEVGESDTHAAEEPQEIRTEIPAPTDEGVHQQPRKSNARNKGKRPVVEYSPLQHREPEFAIEKIEKLKTKENEDGLGEIQQDSRLDCGVFLRRPYGTLESNYPQELWTVVLQKKEQGTVGMAAKEKQLKRERHPEQKNPEQTLHPSKQKNNQLNKHNSLPKSMLKNARHRQFKAQNKMTTQSKRNGQSIHITAADVAATLGHPMGHIEITRKTARAVPKILKEWRAIFEKTTAYPMINGYVNQNYIDHLRDVDNIPNLYWCQMVINSLVTSKLGWERNTDKIFGGPILFLTVKPLSSPPNPLKHHTQSVKYNMQLLLKREENEIKSGGFGYVHIDSALQLENAPPEEEGPSIPQADVPPQPQPQEENPARRITETQGPLRQRCLEYQLSLRPHHLQSLRMTDSRKCLNQQRQLLGIKAQEEQQLTFSQEEDAYWVAREYADGEQRQGGDAVEITIDGGEGEVGEAIPHAAERPQEIRTEIPAPTDEVTPDQAQPGSSSEPPPEIQPKDKGKRPVVEYSPLQPRQRLAIIDINAPINATEEAVRKWVFENPNPDM